MTVTGNRIDGLKKWCTNVSYYPSLVPFITTVPVPCIVNASYGLITLHKTGNRTSTGNGTCTIEKMGPDPCPCLRPVLNISSWYISNHWSSSRSLSLYLSRPCAVWVSHYTVSGTEERSSLTTTRSRFPRWSFGEHKTSLYPHLWWQLQPNGSLTSRSSTFHLQVTGCNNRSQKRSTSTWGNFSEIVEQIFYQTSNCCLLCKILFLKNLNHTVKLLSCQK